MYEVKNMIIHFSQWLYPWLSEISMAIVSTVLILSVGLILKFVKQQIVGLHFVFRSLIFILLCSLGSFAFASLLVYLTPMLSKLLTAVGMIYLGPCVLCIFITLGLLAEKKNHI